MVVIVNEPSGDHYYGGDVAAPVFSKVMAGALRMLNVRPDALSHGDGQSRITALSEQGGEHG